MTDETVHSRMSPATRGFAYAAASYLLWGMLPIYLKAIDHIPATEVVAHRIIWSVPLTGLLLIWLGRTADIVAAFKSPRTMLMSGLTASLITANWCVYVWAIGVGQTLEAALGYYITPLFSVLLGTAVLGEKMTRGQVAAVALAGVAVAVLASKAGGLPWVSIALTLSWGFYMLFKKMLPVAPAPGFFLEVLLLAVPALAYAAWLSGTGTSHFGPTGTSDVVMLIGCGVVTAVPLLLFINGAKLLRLSTIGIMQYILPTMIFLIAVFVFHEPFGIETAVAFVLIWTALAIYSWPMAKAMLRR